MGTEERDHVILINAVARNADAANNPAATIDRHATRENLQAVLQPVLTRHNLRKRGANRGRVSGRRACDEGKVLADIADDQRRLKARRAPNAVFPVKA